MTIPDPIMWGYGLTLGDFQSRAGAICRGLIWFSIIFKVFFGSSKVTNNHSRPHHVEIPVFFWGSLLVEACRIC